MDETMDTPDLGLAAIDHATLTPLVQRALGSNTAQVANWQVQQLHGGIAVGSAVFRLTGQAGDRGQSTAWSLILKVLRPGVGSAEASAWNYYRREADAYQSGWLANLPGGLAAPRCFGVAEHQDGSSWLWLEELADQAGSPWPLERYGLVARHLGQFNGAYMVDRPLPSWTWLSSGWLRQVIESSAPAIPLLRDSLDHPLIRRRMPGDAGDR